ncbi:MAG TPA: preprotein translocase subunit SecE [Mycobacteriales bacterium]|nr:preprotein translocase subunit SecE [Mycobacteriales bacterium]
MSDSAETATGLGSAGDRGPDRRSERGGGRRNPFRAVLVFYRQVVAELRKVIWPTRRELVTYTAVVLVFVLFMVAIVSLFDFGASQAVLEVFGD